MSTHMQTQLASQAKPHRHLNPHNTHTQPNCGTWEKLSRLDQRCHRWCHRAVNGKGPKAKAQPHEQAHAEPAQRRENTVPNHHHHHHPFSASPCLPRQPTRSCTVAPMSLSTPFGAYRISFSSIRRRAENVHLVLRSRRQHFSMMENIRSGQLQVRGGGEGGGRKRKGGREVRRGKRRRGIEKNMGSLTFASLYSIHFLPPPCFPLSSSRPHFGGRLRRSPCLTRMKTSFTSMSG